MSRKSSRRIFLLYVCDEWKSTESMQLVCATISPYRLRKAIADCILDGTMQYNNGFDSATPRLQEVCFREDWQTETRKMINDRLTYGFYDYVIDGERN